MELVDGDSLPNCCPEGDRLWQKYSDSIRINLEIFIKHLTATSEKDFTIATQLAPVLHQAAEVRLHNRLSHLEHGAAHNVCPLATVMS
jgi:hypothetical protein